MGLIKPQSGSISYCDTSLTHKDITEHAKSGIAYSFQLPPHFKGLTVKDLLQIASTGHETFIKDEDTDYKTLIESVGLDESYLDREINNTLSGGELKRIEIASIIARNAQVSIFDEPEAGIDLWSFERLTKLFKKMHDKAAERILIVISHQERLIQQADRVIVLRDGEIASDSDKGQSL
jgi:Fe-S cluster assembly ATP-binding protein